MSIFVLFRLSVGCVAVAASATSRGLADESVSPSRVEPTLPRYVPRVRELAETLHSVGSDTTDVVVFGWIQLFRKYYPDVRVTMEARSSLTACPALTSGAADLGPMAPKPPHRGVQAL